MILAHAAVWPQGRAATVKAMGSNPLMHRVRAILGVLLLAACASPADPSQARPSAGPSEAAASLQPSSTPTPSDAESPVPSVAAAGPPPTIAWSEHAFGEFAGFVVADTDRFVVVSGESGNWGAWTSTDGTSWEGHAVPDPSTHCDAQDPICMERSARMGPLVRLHDTLYSFGATAFFNDGVRSVGWRWTDGQEWQVIESESPIFGAGAIKAATASETAIFAVTHAGYPLSEWHWRWTADTSWQQVGEQISVENPIEYRSVAWADGRFLAVGAVWEFDEDTPAEEWESSPAVWSSVDGAIWTSLTPPGDAEALCSVSGLDDTFVALGVNDGHPTTWRSLDGVRWDIGTLPTSVADASCAGNVVRLSNGFLAFVNAGDLTPTWTSSDGSTWEEGPTLDIRTGPFSMAAVDDRVVAFGRRGPIGGDETQLLFVGTVNSSP